MAVIIDGKQVSATIKEELREETARIKKQHDTVPGLAVILVGTDPASMSYVRSKHIACTKLGIYARDYQLQEDTTEAALLEIIHELNADDAIDGILVQLPLPKHINEDHVLMAIDPAKDVDGFHPENVGRMVTGMETYYPCTPYGIIKLLEYCSISTEGKHVCIVGRSNIVGKPIANMLLQKSPSGNATVTVCHSRTPDIAYFTRQADIVIAAVGRAQMITADMIKDQAVVIDVGVNRVEDASRKRGYRLVGDVDFESVKEKASYITPVPGGVGPMTITMLMYNTIASAQRRIRTSQK
jgi:methylenetetrahydrofolate dehydrogenase (NADP+) / methenyltetrahydrofolate cyclohydrolase